MNVALSPTSTLTALQSPRPVLVRGQLVKGSQARRSTVCSGISGFLTLMEF